jgi:hypothetical protein
MHADHGEVTGSRCIYKLDYFLRFGVISFNISLEFCGQSSPVGNARKQKEAKRSKTKDGQ